MVDDHVNFNATANFMFMTNDIHQSNYPIKRRQVGALIRQLVAIIWITHCWQGFWRMQRWWEVSIRMYFSGYCIHFWRHMKGHWLSPGIGIRRSCPGFIWQNVLIYPCLVVATFNLASGWWSALDTFWWRLQTSMKPFSLHWGIEPLWGKWIGKAALKFCC